MFSADKVAKQMYDEERRQAALLGMHDRFPEWEDVSAEDRELMRATALGLLAKGLFRTDMGEGEKRDAAVDSLVGQEFYAENVVAPRFHVELIPAKFDVVVNGVRIGHTHRVGTGWSAPDTGIRGRGLLGASVLAMVKAHVVDPVGVEDLYVKQLQVDMNDPSPRLKRIDPRELEDPDEF